MTDEAVGRALDLAQQLLLDTAQALEEAARKLRDYETGSRRLVAALEAAEAETKETWLSLHARAVKAEEALGATEALKDDATMLWNDANKRAVAAEAERDELRAKRVAWKARAAQVEAENRRLREALEGLNASYERVDNDNRRLREALSLIPPTDSASYAIARAALAGSGDE